MRTQTPMPVASTQGDGDGRDFVRPLGAAGSGAAEAPETGTPTIDLMERLQTSLAESGAAELEYRGRALSAEPSNASLAYVANLLNVGRPAYVCLEPGDATRYDLLIVPFNGICNGPNEPGLPTWNPAETHLVVTRLVGMRPGPSAVIWRDCWDGEHRELALYGVSVNEWTHQVFAWWFARLWEALSLLGRSA